MMVCARASLTETWIEEICWLTVQSRMCVHWHTWTDDGITYDNTVYGYLPWQWEIQHKDQCPIKCGQKNSTGMSIRCVLRKLRIYEIKCRLPTGSGERLHRICAATTTSGKFARVIFILLSLQNQIRNRNRLEWFKSPTTPCAIQCACLSA